MRKTYDQAKREVDQITDGLNMPVDEGIKKAVIALRMWGFPTDGSCEGHLQRALPYPWIDIYAPEQAESEWIQANAKERRRLRELLAEFYGSTQHHGKFQFEDIGIFGGFRLKSSWVKSSQKPNPQRLKESREDFESLAEFLLKSLR